MLVNVMFVVATLAFAFGLSVATYRWFARHNGWPMGEWQAHRPGLAIAVGALSMVVAMLFALARGDATLLILPLLGGLTALAWTAIARVGAQAALILAPLCVVLLIILWIAAASQTVTADLARSVVSVAGLSIESAVPSSPAQTSGAF